MLLIFSDLCGFCHSAVGPAYHSIKEVKFVCTNKGGDIQVTADL